MDVETGARKLLVLVVIGVALVIALGVSYTNLINNKTQLNTYATSAANNAIITNFSTNAGNVANTGGSNANYAYYILFAALIIAVVIGALVTAASKKGA